MSEENKPLATFRDKGISITAWKNNDKVSYKIEKSYYSKKDEKYIKTDYYFFDELIRLLKLLKECAEHEMAKANYTEKNDNYDF